MEEISNFDVMIVYTHRLARSADSLSEKVLTPFRKVSKNENYNVVYGYFLKICEKNNLKAAFTTSADITGAGKCKSYWTYENNKWVKVIKTGYSKQIFDKFSPSNKRIENSRKLLFSSKEIKPFNPPLLFNLFFDKQKTYIKFPKYSLPTVAIKDATRKSIDRACKTLQGKILKHPNKNDFSREIVIKDRFGAGGINVYKFKVAQAEKIIASMKRNLKITYIIQPFVKFDKGFKYRNTMVPADIRLIYLGGKIIQTYIRMPKKGEFRCNEHQGGKLKYISKNELPSDLIERANKIVKTLDKKSTLYALDFLISNHGNIFFLEGNTGPGLDWNLCIKENRIEAQKLIRIIVKELAKLVRQPILLSKKETNQIVTKVQNINEYPAMSKGLI